MTDARSASVRMPAGMVYVLWLAAGAYFLFAGWKIHAGFEDAANGGIPFYTDFTPRYAASLLVREVPAEYLYLRESMVEYSIRATHAMHADLSDAQARAIGWSPWWFPPTFIAAVLPLSFFPYWFSLPLWLALTALPYFAAMRMILPARLAWPVALSAPPFFYNLLYGQTGFLTAGLIGLGLLLLGSRPLLAGVLIGLASVKPTLGLLVPVALLAGGHWRTFLAAVVTVGAMVAASLLAFGDEPWYAFIGMSLSYPDAFRAGAFRLESMITVLPMLSLAGLSDEAAWFGQGAMTVGMSGLVAWVWWRGRKRRETMELQIAILCLATFLAVPMAYLYDMVLVAPAAALIGVHLANHGARRWELAGLFILYASLIIVLPTAKHFGIPIAPFLLLCLLSIASRRFWIATRAASNPSVPHE